MYIVQLSGIYLIPWEVYPDCGLIHWVWIIVWNSSVITRGQEMHWLFLVEVDARVLRVGREVCITKCHPLQSTTGPGTNRPIRWLKCPCHLRAIVGTGHKTLSLWLDQSMTPCHDFLCNVSRPFHIFHILDRPKHICWFHVYTCTYASRAKQLLEMLGSRGPQALFPVTAFVLYRLTGLQLGHCHCPSRLAFYPVTVLLFGPTGLDTGTKNNILSMHTT